MSSKRRSTMSDVAKRSGHSLSTVDRVLSGRASVRADTAQRIREAADALGFRAAGVIHERVRGAKSRRAFGFLLQQPNVPFYQALAEALREATAAGAAVKGSANVEFLKTQSPDAVAEHLLRLGRQVDALAVVTADHPAVGEAIEQLKHQGVPVFALISDLSAPARAGYAGLDNRRVGRTAAWLVTELAREPGPVAVFIGTHRFLCQELCEMSFRSYVRERAPRFELVDTVVTMESDDHAEEGMRDVLRRHPDLAGFYVGGGGLEGVLRALTDRDPTRRLIGIGHDLTGPTREALRGGLLHALLSHPLPAIASALVAQMAGALENAAVGLRQVVASVEIYTPENV
jgi:LacI family transcriptional regulator